MSDPLSPFIEPALERGDPAGASSPEVPAEGRWSPDASLPEHGLVVLLGDAGSGKTTWLSRTLGVPVQAAEWSFDPDEAVDRPLALDELDRVSDTGRLRQALRRWLNRARGVAPQPRLVLACRTSYWRVEASHWQVLTGAFVLRLAEFDDERVKRLGEALGAPDLLERLQALGGGERGPRRPQELVWLAGAQAPGAAEDLLAGYVRAHLVDRDPVHRHRLEHLSLEARALLLGRAVGAALLQGYDALMLEPAGDGVAALPLAEALLDAPRDLPALLALPLLRAEGVGATRWRTPHRRIDEHLTALALRGAAQALPVEVVASVLGPRNGCPASLFGVFHRWLEVSERAEQLALVRWDPVAVLAWPGLHALATPVRVRWFEALARHTERLDGTPWFLAETGWEVTARWLDAGLAQAIEGRLCEILAEVAQPPSSGRGPERCVEVSHLHVLVLGGIERLDAPGEALAQAARGVFRSGQVPTWIRRRAGRAWMKHPSAADAAAIAEDLEQLLREIEGRPLGPSGHSSNEPARPEDGRDELIVARLSAVIPSRFGFHTAEARAWVGRVLGHPGLGTSGSFLNWRLDWTLSPEDAAALLDPLPAGVSVAPPRLRRDAGRADPLEAALAGAVSPDARPEQLAAWALRLRAFERPGPLAEAIGAWAGAVSLEGWLAFRLTGWEAADGNRHEVQDWMDGLRRLSDGEHLEWVARLPASDGQQEIVRLWYRDLPGELSHPALRAFVSQHAHLQPALEGLPDQAALRQLRAEQAARDEAFRAARLARPDPAVAQQRRVDDAVLEYAPWVSAAEEGDQAALLALLHAQLLAQCEGRPLPPDFAAALQRGVIAWTQGPVEPQPPVDDTQGVQGHLHERLVNTALAGLTADHALPEGRATTLLSHLLWAGGAEAHARLLVDRGADAEAAVRGLWAQLKVAEAAGLAVAGSVAAVFGRLADGVAARLAWEALHRLRLRSSQQYLLAGQVLRDLAAVDAPPADGVEPPLNARGVLCGLRLRREALAGASIDALWAQLPTSCGGRADVRAVIGDPFQEPSHEGLDRLRLRLGVDLDRAVAFPGDRVLHRLGAEPDQKPWPDYARKLLLEQARREYEASLAVPPEPTPPGAVLDLEEAPVPVSAENRRWHHQRARDELRHLTAGLHRLRPLGPHPRVAKLLAGERPPGIRGVFLCYSRQNDDEVQQLYTAIEQRLGEGLVFKDTESIAPSEAWYERLRVELGRVSLLVVWGTTEWLEAPYPRWELGYAQALGARVLPILVGESTIKTELERLRGLADSQWVKAPGVLEGDWAARLAEQVEEALHHG